MFKLNMLYWAEIITDIEHDQSADTFIAGVCLH